MQYRQFILNGSATEYYANLDFNNGEVHDGSDDAAKDEAFLHYRMQDLYKREMEVYQALQDLQGKRIPQLHSVCRIGMKTTSNNYYTCIPGSLLQYIDGSSLRGLSKHAPRDTWQSIVEEAIKTTHQITAKEILNTD